MLEKGCITSTSPWVQPQSRSLPSFLEPACQGKLQSRPRGSLVFSTDLLLPAVTFIHEILDEPFPGLVLVLIWTRGEQCWSSKCVRGNCWKLFGASRQTWLDGYEKVFSTQKWSCSLTCWSVWVEVTGFCIYRLMPFLNTSPCHCFLNKKQDAAVWSKPI